MAARILEFDARDANVPFGDTKLTLVPVVDLSKAVGKLLTGAERRPERPAYSRVVALLMAVRNEDDSIMPRTLHVSCQTCSLDNRQYAT